MNSITRLQIKVVRTLTNFNNWLFHKKWRADLKAAITGIIRKYGAQIIYCNYRY